MKEKFNPKDWVQAASATPELPQPLPSPSGAGPGVRHDLDLIVSRLEFAQTDITANYSNWLEIGFALADELGEAGRNYFHRISRFHPGYSPTDCNKQYDNCMKAKGQGVTLKTFFHLAKQSGININCTDTTRRVQNTPQSPTLSGFQIPDRVNETQPETPNPEPGTIFNTSQLPPEIYSNLPEILRESADLFQDSVEKDVFLIGSIAVLSGCLSNIQGI